MGDIVRRTKVCGIGADGDTDRCATVEALQDWGASRTVMSTALAARIGGITTRRTRSIEGRSVPVKPAALRVDGKRCDWDVVAAMVDDDLVSRAGKGPSGKPIELIVGHDYGQARTAAARLAPRIDDQQFVCESPPLRGAGQRRRRK